MHFRMVPMRKLLISSLKTSQTVPEDSTSEVGHRKYHSWVEKEDDFVSIISILLITRLIRILCLAGTVVPATDDAAAGANRLHVACGVGASTRVIHSILKCYPEAVLMRTNKGSTPKQCLNLTNAPNKDEARKLIRKYFTQVESRYRPIQPISSEMILV